MNRPDHPDFWLISQAVLDQDAQADSGQSAAEILGRMINPDSVMYAAQQRAMRFTIAFTGLEAELKTAAAWTDGFLAGMRVQAAKEARDHR
jgi:hypothetical protein